MPTRKTWHDVVKEITVDANGCWLYSHVCMSTGYGRVRWQGRRTTTHRVTWEHYVGPIPEGRQIDHLCRVRACCNPLHLEVVDQRTNVRRGESPSTVTARSGVCQRGHSMADAYHAPGSGKYSCRSCTKLRRAGKLDYQLARIV